MCTHLKSRRQCSSFVSAVIAHYFVWETTIRNAHTILWWGGRLMHSCWIWWSWVWWSTLPYPGSQLLPNYWRAARYECQILVSGLCCITVQPASLAPCWQNLRDFSMCQGEVTSSMQPAFVFLGEDFKRSKRHQQLKSMLIDMFQGSHALEVNAMTVRRVIVCSALSNGRVSLRQYSIQLFNAAGSKVCPTRLLHPV